jgi:hypothetical protein
MAAVLSNVAHPHGGVRACAMKKDQCWGRLVSAGDDERVAVACGYIACCARHWPMRQQGVVLGHDGSFASKRPIDGFGAHTGFPTRATQEPKLKAVTHARSLGKSVLPSWYLSWHLLPLPQPFVPFSYVALFLAAKSFSEARMNTIRELTWCTEHSF